MIIETNQNVFGCGADAIVNTVNCVGFMGKGLALEFALRYPELEKAYIKDCKEKRVRPGKLNVYQIDGQLIIDFPTKFHFKYPSQMNWIEEGLADFLRIYKRLGISSVAFPLLGAHNGGLDPDAVSEVMKRELAKADVDVYICHSRESDPFEKEMIGRFNVADIDLLAQKIRLTAPQKESLIRAQGNIKHFYELFSYPKIGNTTYRSLFDYFKESRKAPLKFKQETLF